MYHFYLIYFYFLIPVACFLAGGIVFSIYAPRELKQLFKKFMDGDLKW